jgi:hypothetical protein
MTLIIPFAGPIVQIFLPILFLKQEKQLKLKDVDHQKVRNNTKA